MNELKSNTQSKSNELELAQQIDYPEKLPTESENSSRIGSVRDSEL